MQQEVINENSLKFLSALSYLTNKCNSWNSPASKKYELFKSTTNDHELVNHLRGAGRLLKSHQHLGKDIVTFTN